MGKTRVEVGYPCIATGEAIKMLTAKVCRFVYDEDIVYNFINIDDDQCDLQNGKINFDGYIGKLCDIYGDFLPSKTTVTGKVKRKFLVLRIKPAEVRNV